MEDGKKSRRPNPFLGRLRKKSVPHGSHGHYSETALLICEHGQDKWLEMLLEAAKKEDE